MGEAGVIHGGGIFGGGRQNIDACRRTRRRTPAHKYSSRNWGEERKKSKKGLRESLGRRRKHEKFLLAYNKVEKKKEKITQLRDENLHERKKKFQNDPKKATGKGKGP